MTKLIFLLSIIFSSLFATSSIVVQLDIKGAIGPASSAYLKNGFDMAIRKKAQIVLVKLDTPGGLSSSMREMIQEITNTKIPVVMYVYPEGARAASAGTYLMYASNVAAMAQGTNIGAATPINLLPTRSTANKPSTHEAKAINDAAAYIQSLAELRDRNASWAIDAVRNAKSISAKKALRLGVIDLIANNTQELLQKLDGRIVQVSDKNIVLNTKNALIISYQVDWKTKLLYIITNPNIIYILLLIALYGIFFELMNPGGVLPGVIGAICGIIVLYSLNLLPFNYAGLLLIMLGVGFMIAEIFVSGFGVLGIGGVVAFIFGSVLLFDANTLGNSISIPLIIAFALVSISFFIIIARMFIRSRSAKVVSGVEDLIGSIGQVIDVHETNYRVMCQGEIWNAISQEKLTVGESIKVVGLNGLTLDIKPNKE
ncbi:MAG: nodulation protein NfeD [Sulfurospirillaceae bacterium]|nr:nodulation protein NfeD [Sulfurospirillaceae bacterium]